MRLPTNAYTAHSASWVCFASHRACRARGREEERALAASPALALGVNVAGGEIVHPAVAEALGVH